MELSWTFRRNIKKNVFVVLITFNASGVCGPYMIQENMEPDIYIGKNMKLW